MSSLLSFRRRIHYFKVRALCENVFLVQFALLKCFSKKKFSLAAMGMEMKRLLLSTSTQPANVPCQDDVSVHSVCNGQLFMVLDSNNTALAELIRHLFPRFFESEEQQDVKAALKNSLASLDLFLLDHEDEEEGRLGFHSHATVAIVHRDFNGRLTCASLGDCSGLVWYEKPENIFPRFECRRFPVHSHTGNNEHERNYIMESWGLTKDVFYLDESNGNMYLDSRSKLPTRYLGGWNEKLKCRMQMKAGKTKLSKGGESKLCGSDTVFGNAFCSKHCKNDLSKVVSYTNVETAVFEESGCLGFVIGTDGFWSHMSEEEVFESVTTFDAKDKVVAASKLMKSAYLRTLEAREPRIDDFLNQEKIQKEVSLKEKMKLISLSQIRKIHDDMSCIAVFLGETKDEMFWKWETPKKKSCLKPSPPRSDKKNLSDSKKRLSFAKESEQTVYSPNRAANEFGKCELVKTKILAEHNTTDVTALIEKERGGTEEKGQEREKRRKIEK